MTTFIRAAILCVVTAAILFFLTRLFIPDIMEPAADESRHPGYIIAVSIWILSATVGFIYFRHIHRSSI